MNGAQSDGWREDLERAVLGAALFDPHAAVEVVGKIPGPEVFSGQSRALVFEAVRDAVMGGRPVDVLTVVEALRERGTLERVGGAAWVAGLVDALPDSANAWWYAERLVEAWRRERVAAELKRGAVELGRPDADPDEVVARVMGVASGTGGDGERLHKVTELADDVLARTMDPGADDGELVEFPLLSPPLLPIRPAGNTVLAGVPGSGKSALADQIAIEVARAGWPVLILGLEVTAWERTARLMAALSGVSVTSILTRQVPPALVGKLHEAREELAMLNIELADAAGLSLGALCAVIQRRALAGGVKLVVVDYVQLVANPARGRSREQEVAEVSRTLTQLANRHGFRLLLVSQLSRNSQREKRAPDLHDLRDSGQIEQDASEVVMIGPPAEGSYGRTQVIYVRKQRFGPVGKIPVLFDGRRLQFSRVPEAPGDPRAGAGWED